MKPSPYVSCSCPIIILGFPVMDMLGLRETRKLHLSFTQTWQPEEVEFSSCNVHAVVIHLVWFEQEQIVGQGKQGLSTALFREKPQAQSHR